MKSTSKYILAVCALAIGFALPVVRAEDAPAKPKHEGGKGGERGDYLATLKEKLALTDAQVAQIKPILEDQQTQMKALKEKAGEMKDKREEGKKIRDAAKAKIDAILTPEQRTKFDEMGKEGPHGGKKEGKGKKDAPAAQ